MEMAESPDQERPARLYVVSRLPAEMPALRSFPYFPQSFPPKKVEKWTGAYKKERRPVFKRAAPQRVEKVQLLRGFLSYI